MPPLFCATILHAPDAASQDIENKLKSHQVTKDHDDGDAAFAES
jgi:hypothetical protein